MENDFFSFPEPYQQINYQFTCVLLPTTSL